MTTDVTYRGNVSDPGDNLTETITTNSTAGGGTLVNSFAYSYDANKNKLKETIRGPLSPYGFGTTVGQEAAYDAEDRVTDWHRDDTLRDLNYSLSKVGDWNTFTVEGVTETRTHGNAHELTNLAGGGNSGALTHDAKGNILTSPAHGSQTYTWDFDNQLMSATSGGTHDYYYDALGRRVMKHVSGEKKLIFVHDGQQIIAEYKYTNGVIGIPGGIDAGTSTTSQSSQTQSNAAVIIGTRRGSATIQRKYVYSTYIDERCLFIDKTALGSIGAGTEELFYYHTNNLYSVAAMTDAAGLITERYAYDAYGNIIFLNAAGAPLGTQASTIGQPYTYTGRRLDDETGLYQYRARYYDAALGRFISRDPILYRAGPSLYAYVKNSPVNRVDPSGLQPPAIQRWDYSVPDNYGWDDYHGQRRCLVDDNCPTCISKLQAFITAGAIRRLELWTDLHNLRTMNPVSYNNHIDQLRMVNRHIIECWIHVKQKCRRPPQAPTEYRVPRYAPVPEPRPRPYEICRPRYDPAPRYVPSPRPVPPPVFDPRLPRINPPTPNQVAGGTMVAVGGWLIATGTTGSAILIADNVTVVGVADDPALIITGGMVVAGGIILWFAE